MTTPPNAPEVDVLSAMKRKMSVESPVYVAVAALLAREAALVARNVELERLCDSTYVEQGADAYHHACEVMEAWQKARCAAGKDPGCEGSLCDGLSWLQTRITKTEAERDALAAEVGALREDAERGRWIISQMKIGAVRTDLPLYRAPFMIVYEECGSIDGIKAAIDVARAEAGHG